MRAAVPDVQQFVAEGVCHARGVVAAEQCAAVLGEIQAQLRDDDATRGEWRSIRFNAVTELTPAVKSIYDRVFPLAESLLGKAPSLRDAQISVVHSGFRPIPHWHIDGFGRLAEAGESLVELPDFQLLVGVFLTAVGRGAGNLRVIRGGHHRLAKFFRGPGRTLFNERDGAVILEAIRAAPMDSEPLEPILAEPGDVVLSHVLVPHALERNDGATRPALYFRMGSYRERGEHAFTRPFAEWPPLRLAAETFEQDHARLSRDR